MLLNVTARQAPHVSHLSATTLGWADIMRNYQGSYVVILHTITYDFYQDIFLSLKSLISRSAVPQGFVGIYSAKGSNINMVEGLKSIKCNPRFFFSTVILPWQRKKCNFHVRLTLNWAKIGTMMRTGDLLSLSLWMWLYVGVSQLTVSQYQSKNKDDFGYVLKTDFSDTQVNWKMGFYFIFKHFWCLLLVI